MEEHEKYCCEKLEKGILLSCCVALSLTVLYVSFSAGSPVRDWGCVGKCAVRSSVVQISLFLPPFFLPYHETQV